MRIAAYMLSCRERALVRQETQERLAATDWSDPPRLEIDCTTLERREARQEHTARLLLRRAIKEAPDFVLFLEDDLEFNRHLRYNLEHWFPLEHMERGGCFFGSLYNPNVCDLERRPDLAFFIANPNAVYGSQAFMFSLATAQYIEAHWEDVIGMQDIKMSRLAARLSPIYYHMPSLVQHLGTKSAWGGHYHCARDFLVDWKSPLGR
jgi:hypothetical protein